MDREKKCFITSESDKCFKTRIDSSGVCVFDARGMSSLKSNTISSTTNYVMYENESQIPSSLNQNEPITQIKGQTLLQNYEPMHLLNKLRISNANRLIIGQLNINSLRNKIDDLKALISGKLDILVITESKLDSTFPTNQFLIDGFSVPFRWDRHSRGSLYMSEKTYPVEN